MLKFKSTVTPTQLLRDQRLQSAFRLLDKQAHLVMQEHIKICEIPAPPFQEQLRAEYLRGKFIELGLKEVAIDEVGNVIGCWPAPADYYICLSAHLDTVFPHQTDCRVKQQGDRYFAPGISDNAVGLAGLVTMAKIFTQTGILPQIPILFVATVGEEGIGNLRGVRHLFTTGKYQQNIKYFIAFDGPGIERITHRALGSKRYRVTITGPGGHSWGDFGIVNPIHALGRAIAKFTAYQAPTHPRTSYNVGIITGGNSINNISQTAEMSVDLRSTHETELSKLETYLKRAVLEAVTEENQLAASSSTTLNTKLEMIGHRPSGTVAVDEHLVSLAIETTRCFGVTPYLDCSSTDANIPIFMGLQAITIGAGGSCGNCHTLEEWYVAKDRETSLKRALLLLLSLSGLK